MPRWALIAGVALLTLIAAGVVYALNEYRQNNAAAAFVQWERVSARADFAQQRYIGLMLNREHELVQKGVAQEAAEREARAHVERLPVYAEFVEASSEADRLVERWKGRWDAIGFRPRRR